MAPNDVKTSLHYAAGEGKAPFHLRKEGRATEFNAGLMKAKEVTVKDARSTRATLDDHSFELVDFDTSFKTEDFYSDPSRIVTEYYKEIEECVKRYTGAEVVKCFDHKVRNRNKFDPVSKASPYEDYARGIHTDVHEEGALALFAYLSGGLDERFRRGRFLYINAWRNISEKPLERNHLAVLDGKSLTPGVGSEDYLESNYHGHDPDYNLEFTEKFFMLNEKNSDAHSWHYFPRMRKDEVLLFKQWDSDPQRPVRTCFHVAFDDPRAAAGADESAAPRESIEVRALAFFPDHEPNTCPTELGQAQDFLGIAEGKVRSEEILRFRRGGIILGSGRMNFFWMGEHNKLVGL